MDQHQRKINGLNRKINLIDFVIWPGLGVLAIALVVIALIFG
jgi:hypothetical protein